MDAKIFMPDLTRQLGNMNVQKPPVSDGANSFLAYALVYITAGALAVVPTAGVLCYGQTPDKSHTATEGQPDAPFGQNHYPFDPRLAEFEINIGHADGTDVHVGAAGSAKQRSDVSIGTKYGILTPTTGTYAGVNFLDPTNTTDDFFEVVGFVDGTAATDYNPRVRAKLIEAVIQG